MNFFLLALKLYSFKSEIKLLFTTAFIVVFILPIIAVTILTQVGLQIVSDVLVQAVPGGNAVVLLVNNVQVEGPFYWPISPSKVTLEFGDPEPQEYSNFLKLPHAGIDLAGPVGDSITPFMPGKVVHVEFSGSGYGNFIILDNGSGITSYYAHLSNISVKADQEVKPGQVIGTRGSTGWSTGPHLHFETRVLEIPVNPRVFLGN